MLSGLDNTLKLHIPQQELHKQPAEPTLKMLSWLAAFAMLVVFPFVVYNLITKDYILAIAASCVIGVFGFTAWSISVHNTYFPKVTFWFLTPVVIFMLVIAILNIGFVGVLWVYPATLGFYCMLPEKKAYIANCWLLLVVIPAIWLNIDNYIAFRATATILFVCIFSGIFINVINKQQRKLQELAITDPLTKLLNRTLLKQTLEQAIEQNSRAKIPMTIIIYDVDDFKKINDLHGHMLGDKTLQVIADLFMERCRKVDRIFRLGGEEFLIFLYNTNNSDAINIAEELRIKIQNINTLTDISITASAGVATLRENELWDEWIKRSDENQYQAKMLGKNRIVA